MLETGSAGLVACAKTKLCLPATCLEYIVVL